MAYAFGGTPVGHRNEPVDRAAGASAGDRQPRPSDASRAGLRPAGRAAVGATGRWRGAPALVLLIPLAGCKLIDQTTFARAPTAPGPAELAAMPVGRPALLTIRYATPAPDYTSALATAVAAAGRQRPGVAFDVVAAIPVEHDPALEAERLAQARRNAAEVMQRMVLLGVPERRIRLGAETDSQITAHEVRVYIR